MSNPGITSSPAVKGGPAADQPPFSSHQPTHSAMPVMPPPQDPPKPSKKQEQKSTGLLTETVGPIGHFVVSGCEIYNRIHYKIFLRRQEKKTFPIVYLLLHSLGESKSFSHFCWHIQYNTIRLLLIDIIQFPQE